jgi:hypothetical protein
MQLFLSVVKISPFSVENFSMNLLSSDFSPELNKRRSALFPLLPGSVFP